MRPRSAVVSRRALWAMGLTTCLASPLGAAPAGSAADGSIYTCVDERGRRLTSDRPIPECNAREQRVLNRDGSLRSVRPPPPTAEERAEREAAERKAAAARAAQADAVRRDRNLMLRYPDAAAHAKAREEALNTVRAAIRATEKRQAELGVERVPLNNEAEFYVGKPMPARLKQAIDANDAAVDAQKALAQTQTAELERINRIYDVELERLKRLWSGEQPGTLGPPPTPPRVSPVSAAASR